MDAFKTHASVIGSHVQNGKSSNQVLAEIAPSLASLGYRVESGKKKSDLIPVPVLFGLNGRIEKSFDADAYHPIHKVVLEVEAGRAVVNNQFLKDLFQACMMTNVEYLAIAVRKIYTSGKNSTQSKDFERVCTFLDTLYASGRLTLPLKGVLILGY